MLSLFFSPACSTTEEEAIVYDITGLWQFSLSVGGGTIVNNFSFAGSLTTGTAGDLTRGYNGIYTVNNTSVEVILNFVDPVCGSVTEYYTGVFSTPTAINGTLDADISGPCILTPGITWTATKL